MTILDRIKTYCAAHQCGTGCDYWDDFNGECIVRSKPESWETDGIEKVVNDGTEEDG